MEFFAIEALRQNCLEKGRRDRISPMVRYQALSQATCVADDSPEMALLENPPRCSMTVGLESIASPVTNFTDDGRLLRSCGSPLNTVKGSC